MATVTPSYKDEVDTQIVTWENVSTADTTVGHKPKSVQGVAGSMQASGNWGGGTLNLKLSNDNVIWFDARDVFGTTIAMTSNGIVEFTTAALYIRPVMSGGSGDYVDVVTVMRG